MTTVQPNETRDSTGPVPSNMLQTVRWRCIGPPRGGRVVAVAGDPQDNMVFYFGACAGGVWKTDDGGTYWTNVSDGHFKTAAVGALVVADGDHNVVYAGMGEACIRGDVSHGDGVYRSTDAGKTWSHLGLEETRYISRIRVHPRDPDLVYVAALGHAYGRNEERGVFRSKDGGRNWEKVLYRDDRSGAIDLSIDPNNPRVMYATLWDVQRTPWSLISGGKGSGVFKSADGGDTWQEITKNPGLPAGLLGRIGIAVSPAKTGRVWATVESEDAAVYRSDDAGATWQKQSDNQDLQGRPWYYQHIFADPEDADTVWVLNYGAWKSVDGGKSFEEVSTPHGDNHDLWIDPRNSQRMIEGNDGGACVSFNGGDTWSTIYNQLTGQFYHLTADHHYPYRVYGTQQDNSAISVPSRSHKGAIPWNDCYTVGNSESGYIALQPGNPNVVFSGAIGSSAGGGGNLLRYDHDTGQVRIITVWPEILTGRGAVEMKYRFQWTYPIQFSPHNPDVLYVAGNVVFRSSDQGNSWEPISPDLTRNDASKLQVSGGPVTKDTSGAETYCTVFAFVESPHEPGVYWAGSDDGLVHISRDGGQNWGNVTPPGLPAWSLVTMIEVSPHDPASAYLAATRYKLDEPRPMFFKTNDYGQTWTEINDGIPEGDISRVIREDPGRRGLLYAGTESGTHVSFNDGASWQPLQSNLPTVPVYDLLVKDEDLVAATHGRAFWVLDDVTQIRQIFDGLGDGDVRLLKPRATVRLRSPGAPRSASSGKSYRLGLGADVTFTQAMGPDDRPVRVFLDAGENPPQGAVISYFLKEKPEGDVTLSIHDGNGALVQSYSSSPPADGSSENTAVQPLKAGEGMNRLVWDLRYPNARKVTGDKTTEDMVTGPVAPPGAYTVTLTAAGQSQTEGFDLVPDPRSGATQSDYDAQFAAHIEIRDKLSETHDYINQIRHVRQQVEEWERRGRGNDTLAQAAGALRRKLTDIEDDLIQVRYTGARDRLNLPVKLNRQLAELLAVVSSADFAPPQQAFQVFSQLSERIDVKTGLLQAVIDEDVPRFVNLVHELEIPTITSNPDSGS